MGVLIFYLLPVCRLCGRPVCPSQQVEFTASSPLSPACLPDPFGSNFFPSPFLASSPHPFPLHLTPPSLSSPRGEGQGEGKRKPPNPRPWAEMSKKRKALEGGGGGGEPQLPEEEPTAWFGGSSEEPGRGRGRRQRTEHMRRASERRCSSGMPQSSEQLGRLTHRREIGGGVERS